MGQPRRAGSREHKDDWEWELVEATARRIDTNERDELEAELARHLLRIKRHPPGTIRNWKAFLRTALRNKAKNWIRDRQAREKRLTSLDAPSKAGQETGGLIDCLRVPERDQDQSIAMARALEALDPQSRAVWKALCEEDGNQIKAARRLRIHRNSLRAPLRKIRAILIAHGLAPIQRARHVPEAGSQRGIRPEAFIVIPLPLLSVAMTRRLSGTQWRILLCVIRQISRRRQNRVPFNGSEIARMLSLNRASIFRAWTDLVRAGILHIENGRLSVRKDFG